MVNKNERVLQPGEQVLRDMFTGRRSDEEKNLTQGRRGEGHIRAAEMFADVPKVTVETLVEYDDENRRDRRHLAVPPTGRVVNIPKRFQSRTFNEPYVKQVDDASAVD